MLTSYHSPLNALQVELLRNSQIISTFLVVINVRLKYQTHFHLLKSTKEMRRHFPVFILPTYCLSVWRCFFNAVNTVCFRCYSYERNVRFVNSVSIGAAKYVL
jgi:hypothetical protein